MVRSIVLMLFSISISISAQPVNGLDVIKNMHEKYRGKWYTNLTFKQESIFYRGGKVDRKETWYEAIKIPKGLVIKFASKDSGNGILFTADTQYTYRGDALLQKVKRIHDLLVLGFDVYFNDPAETAAKLKESGFRMDTCRVESGGRGKYYVVGDTATGQFWVTADTYLFTKLRKKVAGQNILEIQFNKYKKLGKGWIATEVVFMRNGQIIMKEVYSDWSIKKALPDSLFDPTKFKSATW